jgi:hypothetical protein
MAVPLLAGIGKALLTQGSRVAAQQLSKKAVQGAAKNFIKNKVKGKKKKSGALVRTSDDGMGGGQKTTEVKQKVSPQKLLPSSVDAPALPSATVSSTGKVSYEKLSQRLDNIVGITGALSKAFKQQLKDKKTTAKAIQKRRQTANKKAREEKLEKGKTALVIGGAAMQAAGKLGLFNFLSNILLGGLLLFLVKQGPKIVKAFNQLGTNLSQTFQILRAALMGVGTAQRGLNSSVRALSNIGFKTALAPFKLVGKGLNAGFRAVGRALYNFGVNVVNNFRRASGLPPIKKTPTGGEPTKVTPTGPGRSARPAGFTPRSNAQGNQVAGRGQQYRQNLARTQVSATTTPARSSRLASARAAAQTGTLFGGRGARLQRAAYGTTIKANNFLSKLFGITNPQQVQALQQASPALKKGSNFMKGARIPVLGPLIVFTLNALDPTQTIGQAAFKAIGMGLGEFLGFAIPIPVLGPLIGGLLGEVLGDVAYSLIVEKSTAKATEKIKNAMQGVANVGGKILDWAKGLVGRFFDALPKLKVPGWVPGIGGKEIIDPTAVIGPRALIETPKAFMAALFQPEKKQEGEVKEDKTPNPNQTAQPQTSVIPSSTSPMSMSIGNVSGGNSDFWTLVAVASREDSDGQSRADVAQSIYNRVASGAYGSGTIRDFILRDKQYQPTWDYPKKNSSMKANPEWHQITDAESAAAAAGTSVAFIQQAAADITNKKYQEEARNFVGGRTDFTNYSKSSRRGQVVRTSNAPNNYFGWDWNYSGNTMGAIPNFNTTSSPSQQSQQQNPPAQPAQQQPTQNTPVQPAPAQQQQTATPVQPSSSTATQSATQVNRSASYEDDAGQTIIVPQIQPPPPVMSPQQQGAVINVGGSTKDVLNSYYKAQLLGFLYKQG